MKKVLSIILSFALLIAPIGAGCVRVNADGTFNAVVGTTWNQTDVNTSGDTQGIWQYKLLQNQWKSMAGTYSGASRVQGFTFTTAKYGWDGFHLQTNDIKDVCGLQTYHVYDVTFKVTHTGANATNIHFLTSGGLGSYNISKQSTTINSATSPVTFSGQICVDDETAFTLTIDMGVNANGTSSGCQAGTLQITEANFVDTGQVVDKTFTAKIYNKAEHDAAGDDGWDKTDVEEVGDEQGIWGYKYLEWYDGGEPKHRPGSYSGASSAENFVFNTTYGWDGYSFRLDLTKALNLQVGYFYDVSVSFKYTFTGNESDKTFYVDTYTSGGLGNYSIPSESRAISPSNNVLTSEGRVCAHNDSNLYLEFHFGRGTIGCPAGKFEITNISAVKDTEWTPVKNDNSAEGIGPWGFFALFDAVHPTYGHWGALSYKTSGDVKDYSNTTMLVRSKSGWLGAEALWARLKDYASNRLDVGVRTKATIVINSTKATETIHDDVSGTDKVSVLKVGVGDYSEEYTLDVGDNILETEEFFYHDNYSRDISFELDMLEVGTELKIKSIELQNSIEPEEDEDEDPVDPEIAPDDISDAINISGQATWEDEFNGDELDTENNWMVQEGNRSGGSDTPINWGNNEKQNYKKENITVDDGKLTITAKEEKTTIMESGEPLEYDYTSGRICTRGKYSVGLGYVEARIKLSTAKGLWPAFWMLGEKKATWPRNGEIDIMEQCNERDYYQSTVHFYNSKLRNNCESHTSKDDPIAHAKMSDMDYTKYHNYGVYRNGDTVAFYLDHEKVYEYIIDNDKKSSPSKYPSAMNNDCYILLNLACGGNYTGNETPEGLPKSMQVDYVKYYSDDDSTRIQPDSWVTTGAWDLYNGKDDWCDYATMKYEQSEGNGLGDTKMILRESPNTDDNDKEYGLEARLNNYTQGKMEAYWPYKAKITINASKAGTLIAEVEGEEYRIPVNKGDNVVYTDEFEHNEYLNENDVKFSLGMFPKDTEIVISGVDFEVQDTEWTHVRNDEETEVGEWTLKAVTDPENQRWGALSYKNAPDVEAPSHTGDIVLKVRSSTGWSEAYDTTAELKNYLSGKLESENTYDVVVTYYSSKGNANNNKARLSLNYENFVFGLEKCDDINNVRRVNIGSFTYHSYYPNDVLLRLDEVAKDTELCIKYIEFVNHNIDGDYDVEPYKNSDSYPEKEGKLFAGWFEDEEFTEPHMEDTGTAYAKFIDSSVLGPTKFQLATDGSAVRFLSSTDTSEYSEAGFVINGTYDGHKITNKSRNAKKLYRNLLAAGEMVPPTIFDDSSQFFFTYTLTGLEKGKEMNWQVKAFYVTLDGTKVIGSEGVYPVS